MYSTTAGDEFQKYLISDKEIWNGPDGVGKEFPSLKIKEILRIESVEKLLDEISDIKEIIEKKPKWINTFFPILAVGNNERGDLEFPLQKKEKEYCPDYYDGLFIYKCPFYVEYFNTKYKFCEQRKLKLDGLLVNAEKTSTGLVFNFSIIEIKLATNIWSSYIVKSLIYWLNLNELLEKLCKSLNCKLNRRIIFILGREKQSGYKALAYFFDFENAEKRLEVAKKLIKGMPKLEVPPIRPPCFSVGKDKKCPFLIECELNLKY
jgi:hypothetical protein